MKGLLVLLVVLAAAAGLLRNALQPATGDCDTSGFDPGPRDVLEVGDVVQARPYGQNATTRSTTQNAAIEPIA